jgi:hypothetical protein
MAIPCLIFLSDHHLQSIFNYSYLNVPQLGVHLNPASPPSGSRELPQSARGSSSVQVTTYLEVKLG